MMYSLLSRGLFVLIFIACYVMVVYADSLRQTLGLGGWETLGTTSISDRTGVVHISDQGHVKETFSTDVQNVANTTYMEGASSGVFKVLAVISGVTPSTQIKITDEGSAPDLKDPDDLGADVFAKTERFVVKFVKQQNMECYGYDDAVDPHWLVVGAGKTIEARVLTAPDKYFDIVFLKTADPMVASVAPSQAISADQTINVQGGANRAITRVNARAKSVTGPIIESLNTQVLKEYKPKVTFYIVQDSAGHGTSRGFGSVSSLMQEAQEIWRKQANIKFDLVSVQAVTVPTNLGFVVEVDNTDSGGLEMQAILDTAFDPNPNVVNIYFVGALDIVTNSATDAGVTLTNANSKIIVIPDADCGSSKSALAHELGHAFGLGHPPEGLMGESCGSPKPCFISWEEASIANLEP